MPVAMHDYDRRPLTRRIRSIADAEVLRRVDDDQLVHHIKAGEQAAFDELLRRYERRIYALTYRMMGNPDDAADLTQECFTRAYRSFARTRSELNVSAWLHRIAANACLDALRRRSRYRWLPWDSPQHERLLRQHLADDPERVAVASEIAHDVQRILDKMKPANRLALILREYDGLSTQEIGEVMRRSRSAVKALLFRARHEFRRLYQEEFDEQPRT